MIPPGFEQIFSKSIFALSHIIAPISLQVGIQAIKPGGRRSSHHRRYWASGCRFAGIIPAERREKEEKTYGLTFILIVFLILAKKILPLQPSNLFNQLILTL